MLARSILGRASLRARFVSVALLAAVLAIANLGILTLRMTVSEHDATLVTVLGGNYAPGTPKEGWDHSTGYLRRILADVFGADLTVVEREFTLVGVNPALDDFKQVAAGYHQEALSAATEAGRVLAKA